MKQIHNSTSSEKIVLRKLAAQKRQKERIIINIQKVKKLRLNAQKLWPLKLQLAPKINNQFSKEKYKRKQQVIFINYRFKSQLTIFQVLCTFYAINATIAHKLCFNINIIPNTPIFFFTKAQLHIIVSYIKNQNFTFGLDAKKTLGQHLKHLGDIGLIRGKRLRIGLPVRGQRTKTNAKTCRRSIIRSLLFTYNT